MGDIYYAVNKKTMGMSSMNEGMMCVVEIETKCCTYSKGFSS